MHCLVHSVYEMHEYIMSVFPVQLINSNLLAYHGRSRNHPMFRVQYSPNQKWLTMKARRNIALRFIALHRSILLSYRMESIMLKFVFCVLLFFYVCETDCTISCK